MKKLVIFGASFFDLIKLIDAINRVKPVWKVAGFLDDTEELQGKFFRGYKVLGGRELLVEFARDEDTYFFNNVCGHWKRAEKIANLLETSGCKTANLIHPSIDMNYVEIGRGCILPEGCVVGGEAKIGNFVTLRLKSLISHNVTVEDFVFIGPGVTIGSGAVIKKGSFIGAGATIMLDTVLGEGCLVGAGSVVTKNIPPGKVVAGVPARIIRERDGE